MEVARRHCAACHAVGPAGASPAAPAPAFRDLHKDYPVGDLIGAIAEGAPTGHPRMPRFRLGFADRQALVAYVRSLNQ
jgi:mono/diheme cytochrome c family protein